MTIHVNSILVAVGEVLRNYPPLSGTLVEVGMPLNLDQHKLPWVGVNPGGLTIGGMQIAANQALGWDAQAEIQVFHQSYSEISSGQATLNLMADQQKILTAVSSNQQLDGTVLKLDTLQPEIFQSDILKEHFLTNLITLTYDVRGS